MTDITQWILIWILFPGSFLVTAFLLSTLLLKVKKIIGITNQKDRKAGRLSPVYVRFGKRRSK